MAVFHFASGAQAKPSPERQYRLLPTDAIRPNPNQPRKQFDEAALGELAASIEASGLIQPLIVRPAAGGYELIAGERRLRACRSLGMREVPCIIQFVPDESSAILALVENLQRRDLHYLEEAECYRALLSAYGITQDQLAARLGKSQSFLANKLRLLRLSPSVRRQITRERLTERHARALLRLRDEKLQLETIARIADKQLNVKETERLVERTIEQVSAPPRPKLFRLLKDYRLFVNSVRFGAEQLRDAGMGVEITETERLDGVDMLVKIRKHPAGQVSALRPTGQAPDP